MPAALFADFLLLLRESRRGSGATLAPLRSIAARRAAYHTPRHGRDSAVRLQADFDPPCMYFPSMSIGNRLVDTLGCSPLQFEIVLRVHAVQRMFERGIAQKQVLDALDAGIVIEDYPSDEPFPSVLLNATIMKARPIHCVVAIDRQSRRLYVVTAYDPDPAKWTDGFSRRHQP